MLLRVCKVILFIYGFIAWGYLTYQLLDQHSIRFNTAVFNRANSNSVTRSIPIKEKSAARETISVQIPFTISSHTPQQLRIFVDDCIENVVLNGSSVPYSGNKCLDQRGVTIDTRDKLHQGENQVVFDLYDQGGEIKLRVEEGQRGWKFRLLLLSALLGTLLFLRASPSFLGLEKIKNSSKALLCIIFVAFSLRLFLSFVIHPPENYVFSDMAGHVSRANDILEGSTGIWQIEKPPGYHLLLALSLTLFDSYVLVKIIHVLAGTLSCYLVYLASKRYFGRNGALLSAAFTAVHLPLVFYGGIFMAECLFSTVIALLFYLLSRARFPWSWRSASASGVVFGIAFWLKGTHVFFPPIAFLWSIGKTIIQGERPLFSRLSWLIRPWALFTAGFIITIAIQSTAVTKIYGAAKFPSAGGINLIEGKCPAEKNVDSTGSYRLSPLFVAIGNVREKKWDFPFTDSQKTWNAGLQCIEKNPWSLVRSISFVYYLFFENNYWPFSEREFNYLTHWYGMLFSFLIFPGILVGLLRLSKTPFANRNLPMLLTFAVMFCVWFFKSEVRFRAPFDVVFLPLSVLGWLFILKSIWPKNYRKIAYFLGYSYISVVGGTMAWIFIDQMFR